MVLLKYNGTKLNAFIQKEQWSVGSGGRAVEGRTANRGDGGAIPPSSSIYWTGPLAGVKSPIEACVLVGWCMLS